MLERDEFGIPKFPKKPTSQGAERARDVNVFKAQAEAVAAEMRKITLDLTKKRRQSGEAA